MKISGRLSCALALLTALGCGAAPDGVPTASNEGVGDVRQGLETIDVNRELMITDLSVVNDPVRTVLSLAKPKEGVWSFGGLMTAMAGTQNPSDFALHLLQQWETDFTLNGATSVARPSMQTLVIDPWPKLPDGKLDLTKSPMRLLAVSYRPDLRNMSAVGRKSAGEGRFVFGVLGATGNILQFTLILEYELPATTPNEVKLWAQGFHFLGKNAFGPNYNGILSQITAHFAAAGACPDKINKSCINQVRSNDVSLAVAGTDLNNLPSTKLWELREFRLNATTGQLDQGSVNQSPDISIKGGAALTDFINQNEAAVLDGSYRLPANLLGPSAKTPKGAFLDLGTINNSEARFKFAVNTCDGCHSTETATSFLHIKNRAANLPAQLSGYLTGTSTLDPVTGQVRNFGELAVRAADLQTLLAKSETDIGKEPKKNKGDGPDSELQSGSN